MKREIKLFLMIIFMAGCHDVAPYADKSSVECPETLSVESDYQDALVQLEECESNFEYDSENGSPWCPNMYTQEYTDSLIVEIDRLRTHYNDELENRNAQYLGLLDEFRALQDDYEELVGECVE